MSTPSTLTALILTSSGQPWQNFEASSGTIPMPSINPSQVRIKVKAIGLNPVDWKQAQMGFLIPESPHKILGCDVAGEVVELGSEVSGLNVGDRVWTYPGLGLASGGAFADYMVHDHRFLGRMPDSMSFADACTYGVGALTAAKGFYQHSKMPLPKPGDEACSDQYVMVWGAASAVGHFAVQLAKLSGFKVLAVCSAKSAEAVKTLGAEETFDYAAGNAAVEQAAIAYVKAKGSVFAYAYDSVGPESSASLARILEAAGAKDAPVLCAAGSHEGAGATVHDVNLGSAYLVEEDRAWLLDTYPLLSSLVTSGSLKPKQTKVLNDGKGGAEAAMAAVKDGLRQLAEGSIGSNKAVVVLE